MLVLRQVDALPPHQSPPPGLILQIPSQGLGKPRLKAVDGLIAELGRGLGVVDGIAAVMAGAVFDTGFQAGCGCVLGGGAGGVLASHGRLGKSDRSRCNYTAPNDLARNSDF